MQTFLPHGADLAANARVLDGPRLRKQAVEAYQILRVLAGESKGWIHHPATKMWAGHEGWLGVYAENIIDEIERRGWNSSLREPIRNLISTSFYDSDMDTPPPWLNDFRVSITHQGRLYEKSPDYYPDYYISYMMYRNFVCHPKCNYFWPTHSDDYGWILVDGQLDKL